MSKYSMGLDFGTLSARAVIVDIETCAEIAESVKEYEHGVISESLPCGKKLPEDYALQHPADYLDVLYFIINDCINKSKVDPCDIIGVGVDFTASTVMPVLEDGTPLCFLDEYKDNPHAYVKLWKHHAAQDEADKINAIAEQTDAPWLKQYGGITSSEWMFPKIMEVLSEDEALYNKTYHFVEAGDWIVWKLCGNETHSVCSAGFKALWNNETGFPDKAFFKKLDVRLENVVDEKINTNVIKMSTPAGYITEQAQKLTGLKAGTYVTPAFIDAHAALPALGITKSGELLMIIGTSGCHIMLSDKKEYVPGICGFVKDGIVDDLYAYEAGQSCVGDSFDWFVKNCVPACYTKEAEEQGISIHKYLRQKAKLLSPGSNGILALDWFNGNRTPYVNSDLSGLILGIGIHTSPEEIYRALIESTAYGTKRIVDLYEQNGITINKLYAAGGIAIKDEMLMQIYADVLNKEIFVTDTAQACAYGSAVLGAVNERGYSSLSEASEKMKKISKKSYAPDKKNVEIYSKLYKEYVTVSEFFANSENNTMKALKSIYNK